MKNQSAKGYKFLVGENFTGKKLKPANDIDFTRMEARIKRVLNPPRFASKNKKRRN